MKFPTPFKNWQPHSLMTLWPSKMAHNLSADCVSPLNEAFSLPWLAFEFFPVQSQDPHLAVVPGTEMWPGMWPSSHAPHFPATLGLSLPERLRGRGGGGGSAHLPLPNIIFPPPYQLDCLQIIFPSWLCFLYEWGPFLVGPFLRRLMWDWWIPLYQGLWWYNEREILV